MPSLPLSANISILFTELPYLDRPAAARAAGFEHVETWWPFAGPAASTEQVDALVAALERADVSLSGLNFFAGDMPAGERGVACRPDRQHELAASTELLVRIASRTGCRAFNLLYGQLDDRWSVAEQRDTAIRAVRTAATVLAEIDGIVLLEPLARGLNGAYPLVDGDDVVELLEGPLRSAPNVRLLFDVFHLGSNGVDLVSAAERLAPWIGHVQLADSPGRGEPGSGGLPIEETVKALVAAGYRGLIAAEYQPTGPTEQSLGWTDRFGRRS
ncbi:hydroxypyruvate isomerase family protein [Kribbella sp. C-35]|uniref:hydroxypyruvate isomerase family protein n=1 Tax=Kribbella sp. C-35 TaxID=2789276 RepID=UPI00397D48ED